MTIQYMEILQGSGKPVRCPSRIVGHTLAVDGRIDGGKDLAADVQMRLAKPAAVIA